PVTSPLSLHDALPIFQLNQPALRMRRRSTRTVFRASDASNQVDLFKRMPSAKRMRSWTRSHGRHHVGGSSKDGRRGGVNRAPARDRKSTRLYSSHEWI